MMIFDIFKLRFKTPLHLSRGKLNTYADSDDVLHSDTIKAALYATALNIYKKFELPDNFLYSFQVSSAYPFTGDLLWFPRPLSYQPIADSQIRKELKKLKYLPKEFFEELLANPRLDCRKLLIEGRIHQPKVFKDYMTQRVQIELEDARSTPFYIAKRYPAEEDYCGLYFMVQHDKSDPHFLPRMNGIVRLLGETGIGLHRGLGNGQFTHSHDTIDIKMPADANAQLCLSLYSPTKEEMSELDFEASSCNFTQRGGWISSPENEAAISLRKRSVYMFSEGSVFKTAKAVKLNGKVLDVVPDSTLVPVEAQIDHEVWRDGQLMKIPIII